MRTSVIAYRLFDVADEINLDQVQAIWHSLTRFRLSGTAATKFHPVCAWTAFPQNLSHSTTRLCS